MLNANEIKSPEILECDLCIIGAGLAGMNALFSAYKLLSDK